MTLRGPGSVTRVTDPGPYDSTVESTLERELKLEPPAGFQLPPLEGEELPARHFTSTYYDTAPRSLGHAGITLRRRLENGVSQWQLKLPRGEDRSRGDPGARRAGRATRGNPRHCSRPISATGPRRGRDPANPAVGDPRGRRRANGR